MRRTSISALPAEHDGIELAPLVARAHARPALGPRVENPLAGQDVQGLAQHGAAHIVAPEQDLLAGQDVARLQPARGDLAADFIDDLLAQVALQRSIHDRGAFIHEVLLR
jgi:hypothetical protein